MIYALGDWGFRVYMWLCRVLAVGLLAISPKPRNPKPKTPGTGCQGGDALDYVALPGAYSRRNSSGVEATLKQSA